MIALVDYNVSLGPDILSDGAGIVQSEIPPDGSTDTWVRKIDLGTDDRIILELLVSLQHGKAASADELAKLAYPGVECAVAHRVGRERRLASANVTEVDKLISEIVWERLRKRLRPQHDDLPTSLVAYERLIWAQIGYAFKDAYRIIFSPKKPPVPFADLEREGSAAWGRDAACVAGPGTGTVADLKDVLASLPEEERHIFCLRRIDGFSSADIARMFGVVDTTVRRKYRLAVKKIGFHRSQIAGRMPFGTGTMRNLRPLTQYLERLRKEGDDE